MDHQEPVNNPDEKLLAQDVDGSTAKQAISIKGTPKTGGARIGKNFKKAAFVLVGMIAGGMVIGIMTAGQRQASNAGGESDVASQGVGQIKPPIEQMQKAAANSAANAGAAGAPVASSPSASANPSNPFAANHQAGANLQAGGTPKLTPAQQYQQWLVEQRYKNREGEVLAAQSATLAKISPADSNLGGGQQPVSMVAGMTDPANNS